MKRIKILGVLLMLGLVFLTGCDLNINTNDKNSNDIKEKVSEKLKTTDEEKKEFNRN